MTPWAQVWVPAYLAEAEMGASVEVFPKSQLLAEAETAHRSLLAVTLKRDLRLADLTSRRALSFGVDASLGCWETPSRWCIRAWSHGRP